MDGCADGVVEEFCETWIALLVEEVAVVGAVSAAAVAKEIGEELVAGLAGALAATPLAMAVGLSWVWAKTSPAPKTNKGADRAAIRRTLFF